MATQTSAEIARRQAEPAPLSPAALDAAPGAMAAETLRAYRRACDAVAARLDGAALNDASLSEVLAGMAAEGLGRSTLDQTVAAVRFAARMTGLPDPAGPSCEVVLQAHRRSTAPGRQVAAVDWPAADAAGAVLYLGPATMRRVSAWLAAAQTADGPLFRPVGKSGSVAETRITARSVRRIVAARAADIGIDGASGHSLRVGAEQSLVRAGATLPEAQQAGRWQSPAMPARYAQAELAGRGAVARLRHGVQT